MAQIDIDKFVISLMRYFGNNKGIATTLDRCLFSLGLKYVDTLTGGRLERVDQPTMLEKIMWESGEQMPAMIKWKGDNLKEVVDLTGVYKEGFEKWFHNSWEECEKYVHEHNNIFKIFNEDGSHMEVPIGAWIIKAPDGYNTASRFRFVPKSDEWSEEDEARFESCIKVLQTSDGYDTINVKWLKSLKDRVGCASHFTTTKQWSKEDRRIFDNINLYIRKAGDYPHFSKEYIKEAIDWLKSFKDRVQPQPKQEWNEEDINMIDWLIRCCEKEHEELCNDKYGHQDIVSDLKRDCRKKWNWLESLKNRVAPQKQWKPSETDIIVLEGVIDRGINPINYHATLHEILEQLKKLKG